MHAGDRVSDALPACADDVQVSAFGRLEGRVTGIVMAGMSLFALLMIPAFAILASAEPAFLPERRLLLIVVPGACLGAWFELRFLAALMDAWERHPVPLSVALSLRLPIPVRPLAGVFFLLHGLQGLVFVWMTSGSGSEHWALRALMLLLGAGLTSLTFGYVLLAVAALVRRERLLVRLWALRVPLSLGIVALAPLLPHAGVVGRHVDRRVVLATAQRKISAPAGGPVRIALTVRNSGRRHEKLVVDDVDHVMAVSVDVPGGGTYERARSSGMLALLRPEPRREVLQVGKERVLGVLTLHADDEWRHVAGAQHVRPLTTPGRHVVRLTYDDRNGPNHGALARLEPLTVVVLVK